VSLTRDGEKLMKSAFLEHERAMERAARVLTKSERVAIIDLLKKLGTNAAMQLEDVRRVSSPTSSRVATRGGRT
jgi:MarR family 2-MHQ and catechol resistance regulon transcriptional repressor